MRVLGIDLAWSEGTTTRRPNESGVVAVDACGTVIDAGWTIGLEATHAWVDRWASNDTLLFVDAPLVVQNATGQRTCERDVGRYYGRWKASADSTNAASPRLAGVAFRRGLEDRGWRYDDGRAGPPEVGIVVSECYPYTTIVGAPEMGFDFERPRCKRKPRSMRAAEFRPIRATECDALVASLSALDQADPALLLRSHPVTAHLLTEQSPLDDRPYKHREDLIDALICAWTGLLWIRYGIARCQVLGLNLASAAPAATIIAPCSPEQRSVA